MSRTYSSRWCYVCGRDISSAGLAWYNHCMKHVREGNMTKEVYTDRNYHDSIDFQIVKGVKIVAPPKNTSWRDTHKGVDEAWRKYYSQLHDELQ